ncbi:MAG: pyridoxamine 5'-phosphate oxidase family protein [Proteobacteria bacterium]|nr:pyridoxamine 5'-phosphate oxidase family protein [Pseudomonadota bacterium]
MAMSKPDREAFLAGGHVGIVSIAREGKGPLTVPIWYDYQPGGDVWMLTGPDSLKGRALQSAKRISLCAQDESLPYKYVSVEGPFVIGPASAGQLLSMAQRYLGEEMGKAYASNSTGDDSVLVTLTPEVWYSVAYPELV